MKYLLLCQMQPAAMTDVPEAAMQQIMDSMMAGLVNIVSGRANE